MLSAQVSAASSPVGLGERIVHRLLTRSPLGPLVRWVAGIEASVHAKLLGAFLRELHRLYSDQRQAAQQLQTLNDELERASQAKSEFLASMSHELRTPLNATLGHTELIQDEIYGEVPAKIRDVLARVQQNGRHLLGLINDVLDRSRIEAGRVEFNPAEYSVRDIVETVTSSLRPLAEEKGLALVAAAQVVIPPCRRSWHVGHRQAHPDDR